MALVVLLRGVNVGGHRRLRPSELARDLQHLGVVSIGAAGTFVVPGRVTRRDLREVFARQLPFKTEIMIRGGAEVKRLVSLDYFQGYAERPDLVRFVSVLGRAPRSAPAFPVDLPPTGPWLVRALAYQGAFVVGLYRRQMKALGELARLERMLGVPVTTRGWNTMCTVAEVLGRIP